MKPSLRNAFPAEHPHLRMEKKQPTCIQNCSHNTDFLSHSPPTFPFNSLVQSVRPQPGLSERPFSVCKRHDSLKTTPDSYLPTCTTSCPKIQYFPNTPANNSVCRSHSLRRAHENRFYRVLPAPGKNGTRRIPLTLPRTVFPPICRLCVETSTSVGRSPHTEAHNESHSTLTPSE